MSFDTIFQLSASSLRFGSGCTREIGIDLQDLKVRRAMLVIDPAILDLHAGVTARQALEEAKVPFAIFDRVRVEPTDVSFREAAAFAREGEFDAFVAVGGGSTIDTAKAANLFATHPADFFDYVNAPIGKGLPVPGPLKPLIAVPTTAGTGSEATGTAICDLHDRHLKTGIAHRYLKPSLAIVDPENTRSQPSAVAASTGLDVLSHALESFTAIPYTSRPRPGRPGDRPAYQGANPLSDVWALRALEIVDESLIRAVEDPGDDEARSQMLLAAAIAGIGFGNAGVHLPHGMAYPVAGMVRSFWPAGYAVDHPIVPHGISVIVNTPAVVRFTAPVSPERHRRAAEALGADVSRTGPADVGRALADRILEFMQRLKMPNGLRALGYEEADIPGLVQGTLPQQRVTKLSPRPAGEAELSQLFQESLTLW